MFSFHYFFSRYHTYLHLIIQKYYFEKFGPLKERKSELERQISIHSTPLHMEWDQKKFNIIDAPGYSDFIGESISSLAVVDMAAVIIHSVNRIELGTETMRRASTELGIPKVLVVNGLDREHTKFSDILNQAKERFGKNVFPMQLPVNSGPGFNQIVDVLRRELITYQTDGSGKYSEGELPEDLVSDVDGLHSELIEYVAESDDSLLEKYFDQLIYYQQFPKLNHEDQLFLEMGFYIHKHPFRFRWCKW